MGFQTYCFPPLQCFTSFWGENSECFCCRLVDHSGYVTSALGGGEGQGRLVNFLEGNVAEVVVCFFEAGVVLFEEGELWERKEVCMIRRVSEK